MPNGETTAERYRRLAAECLDVAHNFPLGDTRDALLQMAQVWQRLGDQYDDATPPFSQPAAEQPADAQRGRAEIPAARRCTGCAGQATLEPRRRQVGLHRRRPRAGHAPGAHGHSRRSRGVAAVARRGLPPRPAHAHRHTTGSVNHRGSVAAITASRGRRARAA